MYIYRYTQFEDIKK